MNIFMITFSKYDDAAASDTNEDDIGTADSLALHKGIEHGELPHRHRRER